MASTQQWDRPIDKHTDWGGDASTGGLQVAGVRVQEFIKDTLEGRIGYIHEDKTRKRYYGFSDKENYEIWAEDPDAHEDLVVGSWAMSSDYLAQIVMTTPSFVAVHSGSTGNYIDYTFSTQTTQGSPIVEDVIATYTFTRGSSKVTTTAQYRSGTSVHFNVDKYLNDGENRIIVEIVGLTTGSVAQASVTYQVVNLSISSEFDISRAWDKRIDSAMEIPFTVDGSAGKTVEWYIDGTKLATDSTVDYISEAGAVSRTKYINLSDIQDIMSDTHTLQIRSFIKINEESFYSETLFYQFVISSEYTSNQAILYATSFADGRIVDNDQNYIPYIDAEQFVPKTVKLAGWTPDNTVLEVTPQLWIRKGGSNEPISEGQSMSFVNGPGTAVDYTFIFPVYGEESQWEPGNAGIVLQHSTGSDTLFVLVAASEYSIDEITSNLQASFDATGRLNSSVDRETWTSNGYSATFEGFNWNAQSGWNDNRLLVNSGAQVSFDLAPLASDPTVSGKTLELELSTRNVINDDAIIMDMRGTNGVGLYLTASEAYIVSAEGAKVSTRFKSGENVRISFVINRKSGTTNAGLAFIYVNGINSGAAAFTATDSFVSPTFMKFVGTDEAEISIKQIRIYDTALTDAQILNNYILYRDTSAELLEVYERNNLYASGSSVPSPELAENFLPVMIVTGDLSVFDNDKDKSRRIAVDVEYTNVQNPSRSFTGKNIEFRLQGTSSLNYPRKNYRFYTNKRSDTVLYDANGNVVTSRLYSFKDKAQPVDCWCLKADFAESSGTHNTGVARLWNDVMKNTVLNEQYVLKTEAQKAAETSGYEYDVRTTVDGFPILLYYRVDETSPLIFVGKYNFNNDKSTESVFGFKDIPGFDNSKVECWELLDSANPIALFTDVSSFDEGWDKAFESRYPDGSTDTTALKSLATWINATKDNLNKWKEEKWEHFDVYKLAAYYIYLLRFGAVDQTVKNAMLTTEDGEHWFFINYDNDTIFGVRNDGLLIYDPYIDRQTIDTDYNTYAYAGHDSVLWNNFEADIECMNIAVDIDAALYAAGLTYENAIAMFNDEQAGKWAETIYNQDAQYKYIDPYLRTTNKENNLETLQGSRSEHRKWWVSNRFNYIDSINVVGDYKNKVIQFRADAPIGAKIKVTSGLPSYYGYGLNTYPLQSGIKLEVDESYIFVLPQAINLGSPVRVYNPQNIKGLDVSDFISYIGTEFNLTNAQDATLGSKMKTLIMGVNTSTDARRNNSLSAISGLSSVNTLEYLDISGYARLTSLELSSLPYLKTLKAYASGLTSVEFASGAPVEEVELPATVQAITFRGLANLEASGVKFASNGASLRSITIQNCPKFTGLFSFLYNWNQIRTTEAARCVVNVSGINEITTAAKLIEFGQLILNGATVQLAGTVTIPTVTDEEAASLVEIYGQEAFASGAVFHISAPPVVAISGPSEVLEGDTGQFVCVALVEKPGSAKFSISSGSRTGVTINADTGLLTTVENGASNATLTIMATYTDGDGRVSSKTMQTVVKAKVYPSASQLSMSGSTVPQDGSRYDLVIAEGNFTGEVVGTWSLTGDLASYMSIKEQTASYCVLQKDADTLAATGTLTCVVTKKTLGTTITTLTKSLELLDDAVLMTSTSNPGVFAALKAAGLNDYENYITKAKAATITESDLQTGTSYSTSKFYSQRANIKTFDEFEYFTGLTSVPTYLFYNCYNLTSLKLPSTVTSIHSYAFAGSGTSNSSGCKFTEISLPEDITLIGQYAFRYCTALQSIVIPDGVTALQQYTFDHCSALVSVKLPSAITAFPPYCFAYTSLSNVEGIENATSFDTGCFSSCKFVELQLTSVQSIAANAFGNNTLLTTIKGGNNVDEVAANSFYSGKAIITCDSTGFGILKIVGDSLKYTITKNGGTWHSDNFIENNILASKYNYLLVVTAPTGAYFADGTNTLTLEYPVSTSVHEYTVKAAKLSLKVSSNKGTSFQAKYTNGEGQEVTETFSTSDTLIVNGGVGTKVTVTALTEVEGYTCAEQTVTLSSATTTVTMNYTLATYILIQHVNGSLFTGEEWTAGGYSSEDANGIYIKRGYVEFVLYPKQSESGLKWSSNDSVAVSNVTTTTTKSVALQDYLSKSNTDAILAAVSAGTIADAPAATWARGVTFGNRALGQLPAAGALNLITSNSTAVQSLLNLIGGDKLSNLLSSSTQYSSRYVWRWYNNDMDYSGKSATPNVLSIAELSSLGAFIKAYNSSTSSFAYYTAAEWTALEDKTNLTAIGIALKTPEWAGTISLNTMSVSNPDTGIDIGTVSTMYWGGYNVLVPGVFTTTNKATVLTDFGGKANTDAILLLATGQSDWKTAATITNNANAGHYPAACCCWRYHTDGTSQGDWYLPACGEIDLVRANLTAVNACRTALGLTALSFSSYYIWSSTQYSGTASWFWLCNYSYWDANSKNIGFRVLACSAF